MKNTLTNLLIILLAIIAAIVSTGLIAGYSMYPFIITYWLTLTIKNTLDCTKLK